MKLTIRAACAALPLFSAIVAFGQTGYVTVTESHVMDAGVPIANGTVNFYPVDNNGNTMSYRVGSATGGQVGPDPITATVTSGAYTISLPDSELTFPVHACYKRVIIDNSSGQPLSGPGYTCVQVSIQGGSAEVTGGWCTAGVSCNLDHYPPNQPGQAIVQAGPAGPAGPSGIGTDPQCLTDGSGHLACLGINGVLTLQAGVTITTSTLAGACNGSAPGMVLLPPGTVNVASSTSMPSNCTIAGAGPTASVLSCANASAIASCLDFNGVSNSTLTGFELLCSQSPATCVTGIRARYSQHLRFSRLIISGGGYGSGSNPLAQVYTENDDDIQADDIRFVNSGGKYEWVNGYNGSPSTRIKLSHIVDDNASAIIALTFFNCQFCSISDSYVNENNQTDSTTQDGYAFLFYATNTTIAMPSGCTGSGTLTCTIALNSGVTQLPVGPTFRVLIAGVTGGTGAINGTWDATLTSSTTFQVSGAGNASGASFASAYIFYPSTNNTLANDHAVNCAGTCFYLQGSEYSTITGWVADNCAMQQIGGTLPTGCVALNGGNPIVSSVATYANHGSTVGPGVANGSGQYCLDVADTVDFTSHGWTCNNAAVAGVRLFGGSLGNLNFDIAGITIDSTPTCVKSVAASTNAGVIGGTCQNFTASGLQPSSGGISFRNWKLTATSYLPCIDDFFASNGWFDTACKGGYDLFAGTNTKADNPRVSKVTAGANNHAMQFAGCQHCLINNPSIDTANDGIFFSAGSQQNTDISIHHPRLVNITSQPALWDQAPAAVTIATSSSTTVTVTTGVSVAVGMGIGDYGSGGNDDIPFGTTITGISGTCSSGCTLTLSQAATGTHGSDPAQLQQAMSTGVNITDFEAEGNTASCPTSSQAGLLYGMQGLNLGLKSISCFGGQGMIDMRGQSGQVVANNVTGGVVTGGTGALAAVYMPGGILGSAGGTTVSGVVTAGTLTNSFYDHSSATGNVFNDFTNVLGSNALSIANTNTTVQGEMTVSLTPAAATASACVEQTFSPSGLFLQTGQSVQAAPPSSMGAHLWIGSVRASAANTLAISFCADATGGTPPSGSWKVLAR